MRYGTLAGFPVRGLIAGADSSRRMDIALMVWLLQLGLRIPFSGELTCDHVDELTPQAYRCGQVWGIHVEVAGMRFYHQGSADLI